ncbi:uncharacterized protein BO96DRAFT_353247 [Aspergillus niger CBS 101883]|uniref:Contig An08c0280, genomic contig n=2 Tax=Aspergillus niger TaxID=5061 RepID=A2QSK8_ASPNC|nr:uncharacterized protein BO96DRAFT_353247 [Aspergillus niger CBS 101883]XP_059604195.1 uncharacterized protein An08g11090 [Aspergillus niger]PYH50142.1 hypothetical protein BO96DRAFT_353247 [Aspergillus niger CBS 101883]CAK45780.1 unnamed protein product [Aspergillus niger]
MPDYLLPYIFQAVDGEVLPQTYWDWETLCYCVAFITPLLMSLAGGWRRAEILPSSCHLFSPQYTFNAG